MGEVAVKEAAVAPAKPVVKGSIESNKFPEPKTVHEHYVNNLFDAAVKFFKERDDIPHRDKVTFASTINGLGLDEKLETVSRNIMIVERKSIPLLDNYLEKMGPEKTKELIGKYTAVRIPKFTELVTIKNLGLEKEFTEIVVGSLNKAVDDVVALKAKQPQVATNQSVGVPATASTAELNNSAEKKK